ncbi:response regulator [Massilia sp. H-1]|nr:response regulator [Massilia sp. H-1]
MCDQVQGHFFGRPDDFAAISALLQAGTSLPQHLLRIQKQKRTLLLVDDEPNIVSALKRLLRRDNYQILTAHSGEEGMQVLAANDVDVIVSDQRMPGMIGADFLRAAKGLYPDTIRIMLSGYTELQSVTDAVNEGAIYKFLTKPWDDEQLRGHIADAFRLKEIADDNERLNLELRTANQELALANRRMEDLLRQKQQQISNNELSLEAGARAAAIRAAAGDRPGRRRHGGLHQRGGRARLRRQRPGAGARGARRAARPVRRRPGRSRRHLAHPRPGALPGRGARAGRPVAFARQLDYPQSLSGAGMNTEAMIDIANAAEGMILARQLLDDAGGHVAAARQRADPGQPGLAAAGAA